MGKGRPTLGLPSASAAPDTAQAQLLPTCAPGATHGQSDPESSSDPLRGEGICVCHTSYLQHFSMAESQHCPHPSPQLSGPLSSEWGRDRCLSRWPGIKSTHTPQSISLTDLQTCLKSSSQALKFLCFEASCFQKFPIKCKHAWQNNMYAALSFSFQSHLLTNISQLP